MAIHRIMRAVIPRWEVQRTNAALQLLPKLPVALEMPFTAHGRTSRIVTFGVEKNPSASSRRFGSGADIMLLEAPIEIDRPADISSISAAATASQDVNVAVHDSSVIRAGPAQPLVQLRPPSAARHILYCNGDGLLLADEHDKPLAAGHAGVEQVPLQHRVVLGH